MRRGFLVFLFGWVLSAGLEAERPGEVVLTEHNAMWNQWTHPLAVANEDYAFLTAIQSDKDIVLFRYDLATGEVRSVTIGRSTMTDDHNAPAVMLRHGQVWTVWPGHPSLLYWQRWSQDLERIGPQGSLPPGPDRLRPLSSYAQLYATEDTLVFLLRVSAWFRRDPANRERIEPDVPWYAAISRDEGQTWEYVPFAGIHQRDRVYVTGTQVGDAVHLAFYEHPKLGSGNHHIYTATYDLTEELFRNRAGEVVGVLRDGRFFDPRQGDCVYRARGNDRTRLLAISPDGLRVGLASFETVHDAAYEVAELDPEKRWKTRSLGETGQPLERVPGNFYYFGGMAFDADGKTVLARERKGIWELVYDGEVLYASSSHKVARPVVVPEAGLCFFLYGEYNMFVRLPRHQTPSDWFDMGLGVVRLPTE